MLTIFSTAKPFAEHIGVVQRNALKSWKRLHPDVEVILFGNDDGVAEVCAELGLRHEPQVERNEFGTKRIDDIFRRAQLLARHEVLCYCNCDILLMRDFREAVERVAAGHRTFLMVGRRWDVDITTPIQFERTDWESCTEAVARREGVQQPAWSVDYFAFRRGLYREIPALVIGRIWWDHWLIWKARQEGADVVDCSAAVTAIHQNHGYGYHPGGARGVWTDEQAERNYELAGGPWHLYTIDDATHILRRDREEWNLKRLWAPYWRLLRPRIVPVWFACLDLTRPLRRMLRPRKSPAK